MEFDPYKRQWVRKILVVNESMRPILEEEHVVSSFETKRRGKKNSPVVYSRVALVESLPAVLPFPIEASLEKCWGVQKPTP
jgi:hypothetical protein